MDPLRRIRAVALLQQVDQLLGELIATLSTGASREAIGLSIDVTLTVVKVKLGLRLFPVERRSPRRLR